ncbi:MAG: lysophospholipid acyltransferase family protein, partial [Planctomycetes bacterium]|nr:lysophospholipid acyltransferase family protein [Planctomycetota bacterium]
IAAGARHHARELAEHWLRLARSRPPEAGTGGDWIEDLVEEDDSVERIDEVLAAGRGAIIVTAHLGDWELLCARLRRRGYAGAVIGLKKRRDPVADWLIDMRRAYGVTTLAQDSSPREVLRVLQAGGTVGLLCDLEVRRLAGEFVPFFGRPALTMTAPAALARAHRLPLIPVRCVKPRGSAIYRLSVDEPLELDASMDKKAATVDLMARVNERFEAWIRETPEQWAWHQARWRTRPGELEATPLHAR